MVYADYGLSEHVLDVGLPQNGEYLAAVGGVIEVGAGKEVVDDVLHLVVDEHLSVCHGWTSRQTQGYGVRGMVERRTGIVGCRGYYVLHE